MDGSGDGGVPHGSLLMSYAAATIAGDDSTGRSSRRAIRRKLGDAALIDAAGVIAIFNAVVRIADATGIPLEDAKEEASRDLRADLGIDRFSDAKR